jgi:hypothetical protein
VASSPRICQVVDGSRDTRAEHHVCKRDPLHKFGSSELQVFGVDTRSKTKAEDKTLGFETPEDLQIDKSS